MKERKNLLRQKKGHYDIYVSDVVIEELAATPNAKVRDKLLEYVRSVNPSLLEFTLEAEELTQKYMDADFMVSEAEKIYKDSGHVAIATVNAIHNIVSYNFKHLVKDRRIDGFNGVNILNGYDHQVDITPPDKFIIE